jgi:hypothetical protein
MCEAKPKEGTRECGRDRRKLLALLDALAEAFDSYMLGDTRKYLPSTVPACAKCNHERGAPTPTTGETCPVIESMSQAT